MPRQGQEVWAQTAAGHSGRTPQKVIRQRNVLGTGGIAATFFSKRVTSSEAPSPPSLPTAALAAATFSAACCSTAFVSAPLCAAAGFATAFVSAAAAFVTAFVSAAGFVTVCAERWGLCRAFHSAHDSFCLATPSELGSASSSACSRASKPESACAQFPPCSWRSWLPWTTFISRSSPSSFTSNDRSSFLATARAAAWRFSFAAQYFALYSSCSCSCVLRPGLF
mmetsp:Transcript_65325/g.154736  ORF Transcript_65325/g.154736 Transcript_65325/m.154736 type:complete len:224 (-) Transcript_65325:1109-1780(-)